MKTVTIMVSHSIAIEVDDRVMPEDLSWGVTQAFETNDGRQILSVELAEKAAREIAESVAGTAFYACAHRIAQKYPGVATRAGYKLASLMPQPKVGYRPTVAVCVDGVPFSDW